MDDRVELQITRFADGLAAVQGTRRANRGTSSAAERRRHWRSHAKRTCPGRATWHKCHAGDPFEDPARNGRRLQGLGCENSTGTIVVSRLSRDVSSATNIY